MWVIYQIDAPETRGRVMHFLNGIGARDTKTLQPGSPKDAAAHRVRHMSIPCARNSTISHEAEHLAIPPRASDHL